MSEIVPYQPEQQLGLSFEYTVAWSMFQQDMSLSHEQRCKWLDNHFCNQAELGRIAMLLNQLNRDEQNLVIDKKGILQ